MRKLFIFILIFGMLNVSCATFAAAKKSKKIQEIEYEAKDGMLLEGTLKLPKKKAKKYPLVVMLHSIGTSSPYWNDLSALYRKAGFATFEMDLRGHGKSVYDTNLKKRYWGYMNNKAFLKYPADVTGMLKTLFEQNKKISPEYVVFVGADIGANTAVLVASDLPNKPLSMVLITPYVKFKSLYIPIKLANIDNVPILCISGSHDNISLKNIYELKRYAQSTYDIKTVENGGPGIQLLKSNPELNVAIVNWTVSKVNALYKPVASTKK